LVLAIRYFDQSTTPGGGGGGGGGGIVGWEVVLEPGDILFLPAMYFHHVTTLGKFALSTNVWSEYKPARCSVPPAHHLVPPRPPKKTLPPTL